MIFPWFTLCSIVFSTIGGFYGGIWLSGAAPHHFIYLAITLLSVAVSLGICTWVMFRATQKTMMAKFAND